jgi:hypothetical protein
MIDIETDTIVADELCMPHSPRVYGEALYVLESGRGYLVRIDRDGGRREDVRSAPVLRAAWILCRTTRS